jgi:hypothetical protein
MTATLITQQKLHSSGSTAQLAKKASFTQLGDLFSGYTLEDKGGYITQEFQDFGYRLALELGDAQRVSMYMRLAKREKRLLLERALSFVTDAQQVKSKPRLFLWKLKELKTAEKKNLVDTKPVSLDHAEPNSEAKKGGTEQAS